MKGKRKKGYDFSVNEAIIKAYVLKSNKLWLLPKPEFASPCQRTVEEMIMELAYIAQRSQLNYHNPKPFVHEVSYCCKWYGPEGLTYHMLQWYFNICRYASYISGFKFRVKVIPNPNYPKKQCIVIITLEDDRYARTQS